MSAFMQLKLIQSVYVNKCKVVFFSVCYTIIIPLWGGNIMSKILSWMQWLRNLCNPNKWVITIVGSGYSFRLFLNKAITGFVWFPSLLRKLILFRITSASSCHSQHYSLHISLLNNLKFKFLSMVGCGEVTRKDACFETLFTIIIQMYSYG